MNKSKTILPIILILCFVLCSCIQNNQRNAIKEIIELPEEEAAMYAAAVLLTQDKMGCETCNDSLAKAAYGYYKDHSKDSIYHIAMYFMGKCYMNSDSAEKAKYCFRKAVVASKTCNDTVFQCKSLYALSVADRKSNPVFPYDAQRMHRTYTTATARPRIQKSSAINSTWRTITCHPTHSAKRIPPLT